MHPTRNDYFILLRATSQTIKPLINSSLRRFVNKLGPSATYIRLLADQRLTDSAMLLRPFLVRLAYEAAGGSDWLTIAPVCAAAELLNISSYQSNLSFDGKHHLASQLDRSNQFIASALTREAAFELIDSLQVMNVKRAQSHFAVSNIQIYIGQHYDLNVLTAKSYDLSINFEQYLSAYRRRCYGLSGAFAEQCGRVGAILANASSHIEDSLGTFGQEFGVGLQLVNDVGDFTPTPGIGTDTLRKNYDCFTDLVEGRLTLPIAYALTHGFSSDREMLWNLIKNCSLTQKEKSIAFECVLRSGAFTYAKRLASEHKKHCKTMLHTLFPSLARDMLSIMASQLTTNKYFYELNQTHNGQKQ